MKLEGLHILLTYRCTYECDHCFVWGSPWQKGTLTLEQIERILEQAKVAVSPHLTVVKRPSFERVGVQPEMVYRVEQAVASEAAAL